MLFNRSKIAKGIIAAGVCAILAGYLLSVQYGNHSAVFSNKDKMITGQDFIVILKQNLLIGLGIVIGFISYNFFSIFLYLFNMFSLGFYFHYFQIKVGLYRATLLFAPHGIFEITWLALLTIHSIEIFSPFKKSLLTGFQDRTFLEKIISFKTLILFIMIFFTAFVESYITPFINNNF